MASTNRTALYSVIPASLSYSQAMSENRFPSPDPILSGENKKENKLNTTPDPVPSQTIANPAENEGQVTTLLF